MLVNAVGTYEQIMDALLAWLKDKTGGNTITPTFASYARGFLMWEMLSVLQNGMPLIRQPALYLFDGMGLGGGFTRYEQRGRALPVVRIIHRTIVIYAKWPAPVGQPGGQIGGRQWLQKGGGALFHPLIQAVEAAMEEVDDIQQNVLTLGGLVSHCWLEGNGMLVSSDIDDNGQGMATLPVSIMVPLTTGVVTTP